MALYLKITIIVVIILICFLIFFFFLIYNFPYNALIERASYFLKKEANTSIEVVTVKYHIPDVWYVHGLTLNLPGKFGEVSFSEMKIKLDVLNFSKSKKIYMSANNIKIEGSELLKANLNSIVLSSSFIFSNAINNPFKGIKNIKLLVDDGRVGLIEYSGFKISNFKLFNIQVELFNKNEEFNLGRGIINSDIIKGNLEGYFTKEYIDIKVSLIPSKDFFARYPNLKPVLGSIINKNGFTFNLKGDIKSPKLIKE